jgi:hypothetical protein
VDVKEEERCAHCNSHTELESCWVARFPPTALKQSSSHMNKTHAVQLCRPRQTVRCDLYYESN